MLETWTPRITEHTLQNADYFRTDVWLLRGIGNFEWVETNWELSVRWVEINDIFHAGSRYETEVIDRKITVRIDDTVTLIIENVRKGKKLEQTRFTCTGLTDDINMTRTVATKHAKLMVDTTEIG